LLGLCAPAFAADPPQSLPLWPNGAPGSEGKTGPESVRVTELGEHIISNIHSPSMTPYLPTTEARTGAAFVVVPGGGHAELWMDHEGYRVAQFLADHGVAAFIVKYRLAREKGSTYTIDGTELSDVQRAIRTVRTRAGEWNVDPNRIGVMGFSAGGELALLAGTRFDDGDRRAASALDRASSRPDFEVVLYPGIPQDLALSARTPPLFLLTGADDAPAISQGLAELYLKAKRANVPVELHIYAGVGHGFGIRPTNVGPTATWPQQVLGWLESQGFTKRR
jgi:endo-1,4-beta-xylanase